MDVARLLQEVVQQLRSVGCADEGQVDGRPVGLANGGAWLRRCHLHEGRGAAALRAVLAVIFLHYSDNSTTP